MAEPKTLTVTYEADLGACRRAARDVRGLPNEPWRPLILAQAAAWQKYRQDNPRFVVTLEDGAWYVRDLTEHTTLARFYGPGTAEGHAAEYAEWKNAHEVDSD